MGVLRVGLTGGIASGKSTLARDLAARGAVVVDADRIAHDLLGADTEILRRIVDRFGAEVLDGTGVIDRRRLGAIVFSDPAARRDLEAIVHPAVHAEMARRVECAEREARADVVVVDAALLVETGAWRDFDFLIVTRCARPTQVRRIVARDRLSEREAEARIDAQSPDSDKLARADWVFDSDVSVAEHERCADALWSALIAEHARRFGSDSS